MQSHHFPEVYPKSYDSNFESRRLEGKSSPPRDQLIDGDPTSAVTGGMHPPDQMQSLLPYLAQQPISHQQHLNRNQSFPTASEGLQKRKLPMPGADLPNSAKRAQIEDSKDIQRNTEVPFADFFPAIDMNLKLDDGDGSAPAHVAASSEGIAIFQDNDVLSGRGGATNIHPGNRNFRDLINFHRKTYLQARKNNKPAISRAIVRAIRESGGRFLKKSPKAHLWYEIGDDAAREKASQALRQRAPEIRRLIFQSECEEEEYRQQLRLINVMATPKSGHTMGNSMIGWPGQAEAEMKSPGVDPVFVQAMASRGKFEAGNGVHPKGNPMMAWPGQVQGEMTSPRMDPVFVPGMVARDKFGAGEGDQQKFPGMLSEAMTGNGMNCFASNGA